ncbi:MAG: hypothetical protein ACLRS8_04455 [Parabacteroides merdae]
MDMPKKLSELSEQLMNIAKDASPAPAASVPDAVAVGPAEPVFQEMAA